MALKIPRFEIGPELGHGAHSIVYRATLDGVACALKVPRHRAAWTPWVYREAVVLARVRHAGLPAIVEVGDVDNLPYLAMELIEGETLADRLRRGPLPESDVVTIATELLDALGAVHGAGLVHRDVKPRNILLDREGRVRLVDFGFATPTERAASAELAGTRGYAAPEQFKVPTRVDGRADLYALGVVLTECLTGRLPSFIGDDGIESALRDAQISPSMKLLIEGLVLADQNDRYPDVRAVLTDLSAANDGRPVAGPAAYEAIVASSPVVGRTKELDRARALYDRVERSRVGGLIRLEGSSGSGKTTLLSALCDSWRTSGRRVVTVPSRDGDPPLAVLRRILEAFMNTRSAGQSPRPPREILKEAAGHDLARVARLIASGLDLDVEEGQDAAAPAPTSFPEAAAELLLRLARAQGTLLIAVDDVQWTDAASRDVLLRVTYRLRDFPLVLVLAGRREGRAVRIFESLAAAPPEVYESMEALPFNARDTEQFVRTFLGHPNVETDLIDFVANLAGHSPLATREVLRAFLDTGAIQLTSGVWRLDRELAQRLFLSQDALAPLKRRVDELPPATRTVLEYAAAIGSAFSDELLASAVGVAIEDIGFALAEARRAGVVQTHDARRHRFVHDSAREMLLGRLSDAPRAEIHQAIAVACDTLASHDDVYATATHYEKGQLSKNPARAYDAACAAGQLALERFDHESSIRFLELACRAAGLAGIRPPARVYRGLAEAHLGHGSFDKSLELFRIALAHCSRAAERAAILGRISWVQQTSGNPAGAWETLTEAFEALNARMPVEAAGSAIETLIGGARLRFSSPSRPATMSSEVASLLCELHYQNARLGVENAKPARAVQSIIQGVELSRSLGISRDQARARVMYGFLLTTLGRREAGAREFAEVERITRELGDPAMTAFCLQVRVVTACFTGDYDVALRFIDTGLDRYGVWVELSEYCLNASNADFIESVRGRPIAAWHWANLAIERVRRNDQRSATFSDYYVHRVRALLASLGREPDPRDNWLRGQIANAAAVGPNMRGLYKLLNWGPVVRVHLEQYRFGPDFESLVDSFKAEKHNPRTAHVALTEYYLAVAHARVEQMLVAPEVERRTLRPKLKDALSDLRAAAKVDLYKSHRFLIEAWSAWFDGSSTAVRKALASAEALAVEQTCPWVLSGAARLRAHMLRADGKLEAALDQARIAESLAREHGAEPRAARIREEFSLRAPPTSGPRSESRSSVRARKHLQALRQLATVGSRDLRPEPQAIAILDEIVRDLDADRATLVYQPEPNARTQLIIGRSRDRRTFFGLDGWREKLLEAAHSHGARRSGRSKNLVDSEGEPRSDIDASRVVAIPLSINERVVGALAVERGPAAAPFDPDSQDLLDTLAQQIPLALEMAHLLGERERLQGTLQQAQKMEAVGRLAGGVAHDFNNMVAAIQLSVEQLTARVPPRGEAAQELDIIAQSAQRAGQLTRQLLSFSRHRPNRPEPIEIDDVINRLAPMLGTLVGKDVRIQIRLGAQEPIVRADQSGFEQAIVNLVVNARDAMQEGGTITIETRDDMIATTVASSLPRGRYVVVTVSDTGHGMTDDVLERVFDPFFSTKGEGFGTGLGLTTVYAFIKNLGGDIDVTSEVGKGTSFRLRLPRFEESAEIAAPPEPAPARSGAAITVLLVDDDDLMRRSIRSMLEADGHRVLVAATGTEALEVAGAHWNEIGLALVDVRMPGMSGIELAKRFHANDASFKVVFMSGFAADSIPDFAQAGRPADFLQKPFTGAQLLERLSSLVTGIAS